MNRKIILLLLLVSVIITACHKVSTKEILKAKFENDIYMNMSLSLNSDSSYVLTKKELLDTIEKKFTGKYVLKDDTLHFPDKISPLKSKIALLKNNSIEFDRGVRFIVTETSLKIKSKINLGQHPDIAVFEFSTKYFDDIFDKNAKHYDLGEDDILEIIRIFDSCPTKEGLLKNKHYMKQCVAVINTKGEKEVWINCSCEQSSDFQYTIIDVNDGGPCYMSMKVNLTTHQCYDVHFNGRA